MTLTDFLLARLAETEAVARKILDMSNPNWDIDDEATPWWCDEQTEHVAFAPARVLADVESKRQIVEAATAEDDVHARLFGGCGDSCQWDALEWACKALAAPFADHPDYDPTWRP